MANEFKHTKTSSGSPLGSSLSQSDWEAADSHYAISQALGDVLWFDGTNWKRLPAGIPSGATNFPTGRDCTFLVAASNAPARVKGQADYVCDGTGDDIEIQAAIAALTAGRTWKEKITGIGTFTLDNELVLPSYITFDFSQAILRPEFGGTPTHNIVSATDISFSDIDIGSCMGRYDDALAVGGVLDGIKYCNFNLNHADGGLLYAAKFQATNRGVYGNHIKKIWSSANNLNGVSFSGDVTWYMEENIFDMLYINLDGAGAVYGLNFIKGVIHNIFSYVYLYLTKATNIGIIFNSADPTNYNGIGANDFGMVYIDQYGEAGSVSIKGNKTEPRPSFLRLVRSGTQVSDPDLRSDCTLVLKPGSVLTDARQGVTGYMYPGEVRYARGSLVAGNANAITFAWHNPELSDILVKKVTIEITTPGGTALSVIKLGIADDVVGTNLGSEFFTAIDANAAAVRDSYLAGDTGAQTKWVFCQDSASATDGWIVGQILTQNAANLVGQFYIEYVAR